VYVLRSTIDLQRGGKGEYMPVLRALIEQNPHAARSSHVLHNLGPSRRAWLVEQGIELATEAMRSEPESQRVNRVIG
jgi:hypothetical protein